MTFSMHSMKMALGLAGLSFALVSCSSTVSDNTSTAQSGSSGFQRMALAGKFPKFTWRNDTRQTPFGTNRKSFGGYNAQYAAAIDEGYELPKIPVDKMDERFLRQRVAYVTREKPGTIVVDVSKRHLYLVEKNGMAMRYGVGVGRQGFEWSGNAYIGWKRKWPTWTPPDEMIERKPELEKYSAENGGMEPGLDNPLGARALYLFQDGKDTLYRLHGTPQWASIGTAASSGCIRLMNQDIIDLYDRVKGRAKVVVKQ